MTFELIVPALLSPSRKADFNPVQVDLHPFFITQ